MENNTTALVTPGDRASWHGTRANGYDAQRFTSAEGRFVERYEEEFMLDLLAQYDVCRVLDVPAGTGRLTVPFARRFEVVAADVSNDMLALARRKAENRGVHVRFQQCDVAHLPFGDGTFDAVVTVRLFQHLPTAMAPDVIDELFRVVAPGGVLVVQFRSGYYGLLINIIRYCLIKRVDVRNRCLFPGQLPRFFRDRKIHARFGYKFPASGRLARVFGYSIVRLANRLIGRIPLIRWFGGHLTVVLEKRGELHK
ncbi:MAG: class I SAM-dependent methyltransferase [Planctomycetaceae bacterium]